MASVRRLFISIACVGLFVSACSYEVKETEVSIPQDAESSQVLDASGNVVQILHGEENRESVPLSAMSDQLIDAVLAIEDHRYWDHPGIDLQATIRAAKVNFDAGGISQGGSTITQQYVKNALLYSDQTLDRKIEEAVLAFRLEQQYSKEEILELYLNSVYFGAGAYGVQAASQTYFGKDASDISLSEAAMLAAVIKAPTHYNPYLQPEAGLDRRDLVLTRMVEVGWLNKADGLEARSNDIVLQDRAPERAYPAPYFLEEVKRFILGDERFGETRQDRAELLLTGGLRISTTLDPGLQQAAEIAVERILQDPENDPDAAVVVIDPATGWVRALVGGRDFFGDSDIAKFNLATVGKRPTGSSFKPFVLAAAIEEGIPLDREYSAPPLLELDVGTEIWEVENYNGSDGGIVTMVDATVWSYNTAYAQIVQDVGSADAVSMAARLGVKAPLLAVPSAVLGTNDVSPLDMTSAYATFAARGIYREPVFVTRVEARDGSILYRWEDEPERVIDERVADQVTDVLRQVVGRGTGANARIGRPVAGKTGTGQNWGDAWFMGYTPELVTGVWIGFAEAQISMRPPTTRETVTGGGWPAQIWQLLMLDALADVPIGEFPELTEEQLQPLHVAEGVEDPFPSLIGMPLDPATEQLVRRGVAVEVEYVASDQYPSGIVVGQDPVPGSEGASVTSVTLQIADGSRVLRVPSILGRQLTDVFSAMAAAGLDMDVIYEPDSDEEFAAANPGTIWKVTPSPGTQITRTDLITIWVNP